MSTGQTDHRALLQRALTTIDRLQARLDASERARREPIAIVGVACRFPGGAATPEQFWELLRDGRDAVTEVPRERWDIDAYYDPDPDAPGKSYTRWGAFLENLDAFDPAFFGNAPREAVGMDPQHRLLLEVAWESFERAGYAPSSLAGSRTGVFVGLAAMDYAYLQIRHGDVADLDLYFGTGTAHSVAAGRLAYTLDLRGPAVAIDTACSSSLVAVHQACQSLRANECDMALGGGVNVMLCPDGLVATSRARMMSFTGRCHTFDAAADGYVRAEGCALVVLKRLADAVAARDTILGVIYGTALNQDGRSNGLTAPNPQAQEAVIRAALADAGMAPGDVGYVETHGTGTTLGDPIEMQALGAVFGPGRPADRSLMVGSVKTNVGHLEAAAGVAGLVKVILALQHRTVPPHLHFEQPNPYIPWAELPITVPTRPTDWPARDGARRIAGLSSFGFSGTNAHLIVGEPPQRAPEPAVEERPVHLLALSARTDTALDALAAAYESHLAAADAASFADVCFTAGAGRSRFAERLAIVASTADEARAKLAAFRAASSPEGVVRGAFHRSDPPGVVFLFTGQGSQYAGMGQALYGSQPVFRQALDRCAAILDPLLGRPLLSVMFPVGAADRDLVDNTLFTQPALFALEYALAQLWISWGVRPAAVLGHSLGEYVAACIAGVFGLEDALRLVAARARLMHALPRGGAMAAVLAAADEIAGELASAPGVSVAAVNGAANVVISGPEADVARLTERLGARGVTSKRLVVSHAFHSALMDPMLPEFRQVADAVAYSSPEIDLVWNADGRVAGAGIASAEYWVRHVRQPVQFARSMHTAAELGHRRFLEIGPAPVLVGMGSACVAAADAVWVASLRRGQDENREMLAAAAKLFAHGSEIDFEAFDRPWPRRRVVLPTYPFERSRYWLSLPEAGSAARRRAADQHPLLGERLRSPRLGSIVFQSEVRADSPSFVADHRIFDRVVMPATAYLEMAASAGARALGGPAAVIDASILEPLILTRDAVVLQTVLDRSGDGEFRVEIYSAPAGGDEWRLHVSARVQRMASQPVWEPERAASALEPIDAREFYGALEPAGVCYGATFRLLDRIAVGRAYAAAALLQVRPPSSEYLAHPAAVDAALQLTGAALLGRAPDRHDATIYLPVSIARYEVLGPLAGALEARAHVVEAADADETFLGHVTIACDGTPAVRVHGITFKRATADAVRRAVAREDDSRVYEVAWDEAAEPPAPPPQTRKWLMLADGTGAGTALAAALRGEGDSVTVLHADEAAAADLPAAIAAAGAVTDVVHCWSLDAGSALVDERSLAAVRRGPSTLAETLQALTRAPHASPRLTVVTRAAQPAGLSGEAVAVAQSAVWGLGRAVCNEHPEMQCKLVDLPPSETDEGWMTGLLAEIRDLDRRESQVALRGGRRLVPRLARAGRTASDRLEMPATADVALDIAERGVLDRLRLAPLTAVEPQAGEIQIAVAASGLNFRDVLSALGMYPGEPGPLGGEVVGTVAAVGSDVHDFAVGDAVMALTPRGFCSRVNTPAKLAWKRPDGMSVVEAATIPVVFQTAYYALHHVAGLQAGERILIHAGAGGVGLAAIQLAQAVGAEIFATAGSAAKRDVLRGLGVRHVMDSRSLTFADDVRAATGGEGIDVVLNSLAGDFIPASLKLLRRGGRFVELGKTDLWDQARASAANPHVRYTAIYLGDLCASSPDLIHDMFARLMAMFERGVLRPLPLRAFAIDEAAAAFRYMAQARHVGKVVVEGRRADDRPLIRRDAAYVVTGGLGGVGLHVARWLAASGATRLVLVGRRGPDAAAAGAIDALRRTGIELLVEQADVSRPDEVSRVLASAEAGGVPLRGIVHAAGVLDDGVILQQSDERFARVFAPKVAGGWWLYQAARTRDLDFLVFCSAGAALFGAPGQGNYAAANSFLDALAWHARGCGVPALSVNWGAWRDTGMMTGVSARDQQRWAAQGMGQLDPRVALECLEASLRRGAAQTAVLEMDWPRAASAAEGAAPFLERLVRRSAAPEASPAAASRGSVRRQIEALPPEDRIEHLAAHVREQVRRVLGLAEATAIRGDRGFAQLGMDSLMSVELSNRLRDSLGCQLPTTLAFEHPTVAALTDYLAKQVLRFETAAAPAPAPAATDLERLRLLETVERLDDDEAERSLAEELDRAGY